MVDVDGDDAAGFIYCVESLVTVDRTGFLVREMDESIIDSIVSRKVIKELGRLLRRLLSQCLRR